MVLYNFMYNKCISIKIQRRILKSREKVVDNKKCRRKERRGSQFERRSRNRGMVGKSNEFDNTEEYKYPYTKTEYVQHKIQQARSEENISRMRG